MASPFPSSRQLRRGVIRGLVSFFFPLLPPSCRWSMALETNPTWRLGSTRRRPIYGSVYGSVYTDLDGLGSIGRRLPWLIPGGRPSVDLPSHEGPSDSGGRSLPLGLGLGLGFRVRVRVRKGRSLPRHREAWHWHRWRWQRVSRGSAASRGGSGLAYSASRPPSGPKYP